MRCFISYFGMVGHLISQNDIDIWKLYQIVRHIIDILTFYIYYSTSIIKR